VRPIWTGSISFGLVNVPVKVYKATESQRRISFHLLHEKDMGRLHYQRVCEVDGEVVPWDEAVKGYEYAKGQYVRIEPKDLDALDIGLSRTVDILQFVEAGSIDPAFFDEPYFLEPVRGAERAYALLREALRRSEKVGIARVVFRDREHLAAVRVRGEAIALFTLRFAAEVRDDADLALPKGEAARLPPKQVDLALTLVDQLSGAWDPAAYEDRYHAAMERLIERKLEGQPLPKPASLPRQAEVVDLSEVLRRSLEAAGKPAGGSRSAPRRSAARHGAPARRTRTARRKSTRKVKG
jgi:DNA end-binding protein Ku